MKRTLNLENIANAIEEISKEVRNTSLTSSDRIRLTLFAEEILLLYQDEFGSSPDFDFQVKKVFGKIQLFLEIKCPSYDYRESKEDDDSLYAYIAQNELVQTWKYRKGCNVIHIVLNKNNQVSDIAKLLIAVTATVLFAILQDHLPSGLTAALTKVIFPKIADVLGSVLRMVAGVSILFSITRCILNFTNMQEVKQVSKTVFFRIALNLTFITLFSSLPVLFLVQDDSSMMAFNWSNIFNLFADMIPPDFLTPFIEGNMIQISVIALFFGGAIVALNLQNSQLGESIVLLQQVSQLLMDMFCRILPLFVFVNLFSTISSTSMTSLLQVLLPVGMGIAIVAVIIAVETVEVSILHHLPVINFFKKALPGTIVCLTTASTAASLPKIKEDLQHLGVEDSDISFLLPLEQAFYKPFTIAIVFPGMFAVYQIFNIQPSLSGYINLIIVALIIAVACPPVPGGMLSCLTILCSQMNLPEGSLAVLILISTIMDYFGGGLSAFSFHSEIVGMAFRKRISQNGEII